MWTHRVKYVIYVSCIVSFETDDVGYVDELATQLPVKAMLEGSATLKAL